MAKLTKEEVLDKICYEDGFRYGINQYKLAEFLAEYLPEKEIEEMPGFEGTREDLAKIKI